MTHASYPPASIVACVDGSAHQEFVLSAARWAASELKSPVGLLHAHDVKAGKTPRDYSGSLGTNSQSKLLKDLTETEALRAKAQREAGWSILEEAKNGLQQHLRQSIFTLHWHESLTKSIESLQRDTALVILGQKGSESAGNVGVQVHAAVRSTKQPLLLVGENFKRPKKALLAFDGRAGSLHALEWVSHHPLFYNCEITVLMVGESTAKNAQSLRDAVAKLKCCGRTTQSKLVSGKLTEQVAEELALGYEGLIMGAYGHSQLREWVLGSNTESLIALNPGSCLTFSHF